MIKFLDSYQEYHKPYKCTKDVNSSEMTSRILITALCVMKAFNLPKILLK